MKTLSATKKKRGKEMIARLKRLQSTQSIVHIIPRYDEVFAEGLAFLGSEEEDDRSINAVASVKDLYEG